MASRRAAIASDSGGTLKKERAEHEATKKQLLAQQQEVKRLKVANEQLKKVKEIAIK